MIAHNPDNGEALARTLALSDIAEARDFFLRYPEPQPEMVQLLDRAIAFTETARYTFAHGALCAAEGWFDAAFNPVPEYQQGALASIRSARNQVRRLAEGR